MLLSRSESGNLHALSLGVEILVTEPSELALSRAGSESVGLHAVEVEGAHCVEVGTSSELLQLFLGVVEVKDLLNAVEMLSYVVLVNAHAKCLVDLPLHLSKS